MNTFLWKRIRDILSKYNRIEIMGETDGPDGVQSDQIDKR